MNGYRFAIAVLMIGGLAAGGCAKEEEPFVEGPDTSEEFLGYDAFPEVSIELSDDAIASLEAEPREYVEADGTFSEVLNGVIADDRPIAPDLVLAQLPGGTSNELSRSFGQLSLANACKAIALGQTREIDVFRAEAKAAKAKAETMWFCSVSVIERKKSRAWL
jgi:hypothetical protein